MTEPTGFPESYPTMSSDVRMVLGVIRMVVGGGVAWIAWAVLQGIPVGAPEVIPWQGRWQAAAEGRSPHGEVLVSGRVAPAPGATPLAAPMSGKPALAFTAEVNQVRQRFVQRGKLKELQRATMAQNLSLRQQVPFVVDTGDGTVEGPDSVKTWLLPRPSALRRSRTAEAPAWAEAMPGFRRAASWPDTAFEAEELLLSPGDEVSMIGTLQVVDGRRQLTATPALGDVLVYMRGRTAIEARMSVADQEQRRNRLMTQMVLGVGVLMLLPWELVGMLRRRRAAPTPGGA